MWISGNPTTKSASEMENHFFEKSNNKVCLYNCSVVFYNWNGKALPNMFQTIYYRKNI
jgi:hypothetical protein